MSLTARSNNSNENNAVNADKDYYCSRISGIQYPLTPCSNPECDNKEPLVLLDSRGLCSDCQIKQARQLHMEMLNLGYVLPILEAY